MIKFVLIAALAANASIGPSLAEESSVESAAQASTSQEKSTPEKIETAPVIKGPLRYEMHFEGVVLPEQASPVIFSPRVWTSFPVLKARAHGSRVKRGDSIVSVDTTELVKAIEDQQGEVEQLTMQLAESTMGLERLKRDQGLALERAQRALQRSRYDHQYFLKSSLPIKKRDAAMKLDYAKRQLAAQQEELKQLTAMYEEDELTEETEEIILTRQKNRVDDQRYAVEKQELETKKTLETLIPREIEDFQEAIETSQLALSDLQRDQEFESTKRTQAHDALERRLQRAIKRLENLQADLQDAAFLAPTDGILFYGIIERNGSWNFSEAPQRLVRGGNLARNQPIFSIIPDQTPLQMVASVDPATAQNLRAGAKGHAFVKDSKALRTAVNAIEISESPQINGTMHVILKLEPADFLAPCIKTQVSLAGQLTKETLLVPKSAVSTDSSGALQVEVRTAEGQFEKRTITVGAEGTNDLEIKTGLSLGDIVKLK